MVVIAEVPRGGGEVVFVPQRLGTSPAAQLLLQRPGVFAEYERALIQARTRRGQLLAARQGRVHGGNPPEGDPYLRKTPTPPQHVVLHEAEAEIGRQGYRWGVAEQ